MAGPVTIKYFGWSSLSIEAQGKSLFFDPFFRPYCGAQWSELGDYLGADLVCLTHGHEEHFLDAPEVIDKSGAAAISSPSVCRYLNRKNGIPQSQLVPLELFQTVEKEGFTITSFDWKHRDLNLFAAMPKAVLTANFTQLKWAWSSATNAPFTAPYYGFFVKTADGTGILNYNEGFNSKMTDREINDLGSRFEVDVLLAGMQLNFVEDVARGAAALNPRTVILYPPHDKFHEMMGAVSEPWPRFADAVKKALPHAEVIIANPGDSFAVGKATQEAG